MSNWTYINDGVPPDNEDVIIFDGRKVGEGRIYVTNEAGASPGFPVDSLMGMFSQSDSWGERRCKPVAWLSMPKPPIS
ncbi:hypothetical protein [Enterobacter hormaechei]|uniref:hypothetical protein n=1 Tax=Enterobacter hormaechei TaxID=158836 RepID=UPI001F4A4725|nr:hypothetical protein [Enterobacter hormaechei]